MSLESNATRRHFLRMAGILGTGLALSACTALDPPVSARTVAAADPASVVKADVEEVLPVEDLMREHGVLRRILLIYRTAIDRHDTHDGYDPTVIARAAGIVKRFIEDYHERLEEDYLFPRFEKAGKLVDLVHGLKEQHDAGRRLTRRIQELATLQNYMKAGDRRELRVALQLFVRMYEPHAAREDTVLFPAFRGVITPQQYDAYRDVFEDEEHRLFGAHGFEDIVSEVDGLEQEFGIENLSQFTPL